ncbi:rhodanese-like domain-containing protein [Burkholderiaceae bacterium UC74_6]
MLALLYGLKSISPAALQVSLGEGVVRVFDLNARGQWAAAHVPGAAHLPLDFTVADLPAERSTPLVFYCSNPLCRKAPNAARRARQLGFLDVKVMSAGITGWLAAGLATEATAADL